ncbi:MAG: DNA-3-methyladenine glycosylase I [Candidatus Limnocylindria bacterium]
MAAARARCPWSDSDPLMRAYHDTEWGVPLRDPDRLFELLCLEGAQAGLSWMTILRRREGYREAFAGFAAERIAEFDDEDRARLMADPRIVRNRAKIAAVITNARAWLALPDPAAVLWSAVSGTTIQNRWKSQDDVPAATDESRALSKALTALGFTFVGPTIVYAFMQSAGLVNDHVADCHRHAELARMGNR